MAVILAHKKKGNQAVLNLILYLYNILIASFVSHMHSHLLDHVITLTGSCDTNSVRQTSGAFMSWKVSQSLISFSVFSGLSEKSGCLQHNIIILYSY